MEGARRTVSSNGQVRTRPFLQTGCLPETTLRTWLARSPQRSGGRDEALRQIHPICQCALSLNEPTLVEVQPDHRQSPPKGPGILLLFLVALVCATLTSGCVAMVQSACLTPSFGRFAYCERSSSLQPLGKRVGLVVYSAHQGVYCPEADSVHSLTPRPDWKGSLYFFTLGWLWPMPRSLYESSVVYNTGKLGTITLRTRDAVPDWASRWDVGTPNSHIRHCFEESFSKFLDGKGYTVDVLTPTEGRVKDLLLQNKGKLSAVCVVRLLYSDGMDILFKGLGGRHPYANLRVYVGLKGSLISTSTGETLIRFHGGRKERLTPPAAKEPVARGITPVPVVTYRDTRLAWNLLLRETFFQPSLVSGARQDAMDASLDKLRDKWPDAR